MKKLSIFASFILMILTSSCVMNDGYIGDLYGVWLLEDMEVDGEKYNGWREGEFNETFFQFQNNICFVTRTSDRYDIDNKACTWLWIEEDTEIQLNFTHTDTANPEPGAYPYKAPEWLLLTEPIKYNFNVEWHGDDYMVWQTVNTLGQQLTYYLKKTY